MAGPKKKLWTKLDILIKPQGHFCIFSLFIDYNELNIKGLLCVFFWKEASKLEYTLEISSYQQKTSEVSNTFSTQS